MLALVLAVGCSAGPDRHASRPGEDPADLTDAPVVQSTVGTRALSTLPAVDPVVDYPPGLEATAVGAPVGTEFLSLYDENVTGPEDPGPDGTGTIIRMGSGYNICKVQVDGTTITESEASEYNDDEVDVLAVRGLSGALGANRDGLVRLGPTDVEVWQLGGRPLAADWVDGIDVVEVVDATCVLSRTDALDVGVVLSPCEAPELVALPGTDGVLLASGALWLAGQEDVSQVGSEAIAADHVAVDLGVLAVATDGELAVRAFSPDGVALWWRALDAPVAQVVSGGDLGLFGIRTVDAAGEGRVVFVDALDGSDLGTWDIGPRSGALRISDEAGMAVVEQRFDPPSPSGALHGFEVWRLTR